MVAEPLEGDKDSATPVARYSRAHLLLRRLQPTTTTTNVNSSPFTRPVLLCHPLQEVRSPQAAVPPHPLRAPHRPVVRRRRTGGGVGEPGPISSRAPNPANPTGLRSLDKAGKRREPGK